MKNLIRMFMLAAVLTGTALADAGPNPPKPPPVTPKPVVKPPLPHGGSPFMGLDLLYWLRR